MERRSSFVRSAPNSQHVSILEVTRFALAHLAHELLLLRAEFASELPEVGARDLQQTLQLVHASARPLCTGEYSTWRATAATRAHVVSSSRTLRGELLLIVQVERLGGVRVAERAVQWHRHVLLARGGRRRAKALSASGALSGSCSLYIVKQYCIIQCCTSVQFAFACSDLLEYVFK